MGPVFVFYRLNIDRYLGTSTICRAAHGGTVRQGRAAKVVPCCKYMWMLRRLDCGMPFDAARPKFDRQIVGPIKGSRMAYDK